MRTWSTLAIYLCLFTLSSGVVIPSKATSVTVEFSNQRKASFVYEYRLPHESDRPEKLERIIFTLLNGKKIEIPNKAFTDLHLIDLRKAQIEPLWDEGGWALSVRIKQKNITDRKDDDHVVFILENDEYTYRWFVINGKHVSDKAKAEQ